MTTIFDAGDHAFADGTKTKEFKGTYAKSQYATPNILNLLQVTYRDNENTYTVDFWESTAQVNGSYVKLYMSDFYTNYKYNLTFKPVFKAGVPIEYTVRFDGGDKPINLTGHYGDVITADKLTDLKKTSNIDNYVYELSDYGLALPYRFGTVLGSDGLPAEYVSATARFELVGVDKTFAFDANGGKFADNKTVKTITAPYGTRTSFNEVPVKADDGEYTYTFAGWADDKDATSGSSFNNFVINGNSTVYRKTLRNYTVTFDAGDGHFSGGASTVIQAYDYGDTIVPPDDPTRDEDATYRYVFISWQPVLPSGTTVSASCTYTATYRAIRIDGTLEETGVIVSDGSSYEDICVNNISGYTYALVGAIPTLTITGNGLTFSGTSSEVYVVIAPSAMDVTFDGLTLSGAYSGDGALVTNEAAGGLTINISGTCVIRNTQDGEPTVRLERSVTLKGAGTGAKLSVNGKGNYTVYSADTMNVDLLELDIDSTNTALGNDDGEGGEWLLKDSAIRLNAGGTACSIMAGIRLQNSSLTVIGESGVTCMRVAVSGSSTVNVTASGEDAEALRTGELKFTDFTGAFSIGSTHSASPGIAVMASGGIKFEESGIEVGSGGYNLGGTEIGSFVDTGSGVSYSSFGIWVGGTLEPASSVTVQKNEP